MHMEIYTILRTNDILQLLYTTTKYYYTIQYDMQLSPEEGDAASEYIVLNTIRIYIYNTLYYTLFYYTMLYYRYYSLLYYNNTMFY